MERTEGFSLDRSQVSSDRLAEFLQTDVVEDITSVPGIGPVAVARLASASEEDAGCRTTHQLIGKFLSLREPGMTTQEHLDAFWFWLQAKGITAHRSGIVHAVSEKVDTWIPGCGPSSLVDDL